ncbi:hypothetical protein M2650_00765 [Luteimonas sp. SX5]|uniref:CBU-0592-like domain-containing protein n=1 Tax=Luteimonas galliterrae TaxID=2940486 RepID=A0ABT0ME85_9GAMM|nr:hypothetical protein [Luteimonas galliterrae]MCL1633183.1 hypothetical protein [Luteimonas galliterrae]
MSLNMEWYDWVGILGALLVLAAFYLLQARRISGTGLVYQLMNLFGALGLLTSLYGKFNVSVFVVQTVWVAISIYGMVHSVRNRSDAGAPPA